MTPTLAVWHRWHINRIFVYGLTRWRHRPRRTESATIPIREENFFPSQHVTDGWRGIWWTSFAVVEINKNVKDFRQTAKQTTKGASQSIATRPPSNFHSNSTAGSNRKKGWYICTSAGSYLVGPHTNPEGGERREALPACRLYAFQ